MWKLLFPIKSSSFINWTHFITRHRMIEDTNNGIQMKLWPLLLHPSVSQNVQFTLVYSFSPNFLWLSLKKSQIWSSFKLIAHRRNTSFSPSNRTGIRLWKGILVNDYYVDIVFLCFSIKFKLKSDASLPIAFSASIFWQTKAGVGLCIGENGIWVKFRSKLELWLSTVKSSAVQFLLKEVKIHFEKYNFLCVCLFIWLIFNKQIIVQKKLKKIYIFGQCNW